MPWRTTFKSNITTPLPPDVRPETVIKLLHNHAFLMETSPQVIRLQPLGPHPKTGKAHYEVFEHLDLLPWGMWKKQIIFTAEFENTPTGLLSWVHAPLGFEDHGTYTVKNGAASESSTGDQPADGARQSEDGAGGMALEEIVESTCNVVFKWFAEATIVSVHRKTHEAVIAKAREVDRGVES